MHGGGPEITAHMNRLSMPVEFVGGLRVSDADTVEVAKMVLIGKVNKDIVLRLNRHGQLAVGLCGDDGGLFSVVRRPRRAAGRRLRRRIDARRRRVLDHVARDYIPVIASVGADREGNSYNVNADEAAGAVARALRRLQAHVPHRRRGLAARPGGRRQRRSRRPAADEVEAVLGQIAGGMRPKLEACVDAIHGGVLVRAHRRRSRAALAAARAVHQRGHRHEDPGGDVSALDGLRALEREHLVPAYARLPVDFVRGEGARLWDADGNEYLDFQTGLAVNSLGHCHPRVVEAIQRAGGSLIHVGNLFYTEPGMRLAAGWPSARWAARSTSPTPGPRPSRPR